MKIGPEDTRMHERGKSVVQLEEDSIDEMMHTKRQGGGDRQKDNSPTKFNLGEMLSNEQNHNTESQAAFEEED